MEEYLSPGVYIEEFGMSAKLIEGVSTSTAGFVGAESPFPKKVTLLNLESLVDGEVQTKLQAVKNKLDESTVEALPDLLEALTVEVNKLTNVAKKEKALGVLKIVKSVVSDAQQFIISKDLRNKPTFISSWNDYIIKYGRYTDNNYLAPAVHSFFSNGGERCYVISTNSNSKSDIVGTVDANKNRTGLQAFEKVDEINIVCIPGIEDDDVHQALITHCETMSDRFCILDSKKGESFTDIQIRKDGLVSDKGIGALYYPWIKTAVEKKDPEGKVVLENMLIPPSGAMAGIYARSDTERGVHKAPANEMVRGVTELERTITKAEQDILNPLNINCIRAFQGRGIRVWGARTIAPKGSEWKYISVRRLFLFLEESIDTSTQWVVFEPNNEALWASVVQSISNFLLDIWKSGALMGTSPEEAFFVKCDRSTMTQSDIDAGKLIVVIGLAPTKPAEFVLFRIVQFTANANS